VRWSKILELVATALAGTSMPDRAGPALAGQSMLAVLTSPDAAFASRGLAGAGGPAVTGRGPDPYFHQHQLLAAGIIDVAARAIAPAGLAVEPGPAVAAKPGGTGPPDGGGLPDRVLAMVAICAVSAWRPGRGPAEVVLAEIGQSARQAERPASDLALCALGGRTAELWQLLTASLGHRRQSWPGVTLPDRTLAEAAAAAVIGGAAAGSGVPPWQWLFPFQLFCQVGLSAAEHGLAAIEAWLRTEFEPGPGTADRTASLATLVAAEAMALHDGCACKDGTDAAELGYVPRGRCRQADHDLRGWRPGEPKPGAGGSRYAATLWGWARRWLAGPDPGRAAGSGAGPVKLRPNDVAGCVLMRRWLSADRGCGGPVLLYDRILPEFCLDCGQKARLSAVPSAGHRPVRRVACCDRPHQVYRSEFGSQDGLRVLRPRLGIVIARAGLGTSYQPTSPLGQLRICAGSGRYSLSAGYCPDPGCQAEPRGRHDPIRPGWVLTPLADAWDDLIRTVAHPDQPGPAESDPIGPAELTVLEQAFAQLQPDQQVRLTSAGQAWACARDWSAADADQFRQLAGRAGLELLLRCKQAAGQPASAAHSDSRGSERNGL
jgi:hypothetical protein